MTLYTDDLTVRYGRTVALSAAGILDRLDLPLPASGAYLSGKESTHIPLHRHGVTLRVGDRVRYVQSDYLLKPLFELPLSDAASFEILPGVRVGETGAFEKFRLIFQLMADGYRFPYHECVRSNIGSVVYQIDGQAYTHQLVLDRGAVSPLTGPLRHIFNGVVHPSTSKPSIQSRIYGDFYKAAAPIGQSEDGIDRLAFSDFLRLCQRNNELPPHHPDRFLFNLWRPSQLSRKKANRMYTAAIAYAPCYGYR